MQTVSMVKTVQTAKMEWMVSLYTNLPLRTVIKESLFGSGNFALRSVKRRVIGVVVLGVHLILRDTQGVAEFTVSNGFISRNMVTKLAAVYFWGRADHGICGKTA